MNQLELGDQQKPALMLDNIYQIICDKIYWAMRLVPMPALYDQQLKLLMEKLYSQII